MSTSLAVANLLADSEAKTTGITPSATIVENQQRIATNFLLPLPGILLMGPDRLLLARVLTLSFLLLRLVLYLVNSTHDIREETVDPPELEGTAILM